MRAIYAVDVGAPGNVGWAPFAKGEPAIGSRSQQALTCHLVGDATQARSIALGFEAPGFLPVPTEAELLNRARRREHNRAWCASAGAYVTAIGIQLAAWIVRELVASAASTHALTTAWQTWPPSNARRPVVLLWEAFVSNAAHSPTNDPVQDAATAANAFHEGEDHLADVHAAFCDPRLSLLGAIALWSGWSRELSLLHEEPLVVRPKDPYCGPVTTVSP